MTWPLPDSDPRVLYSDEHVILICSRWQDVIAELPTVDAVITDPPYSERTHGAVTEASDGSDRSWLCDSYTHWSAGDVERMVSRVACSGWIAALTDHRLAPAYELAYSASDRYAFAPVPLIERGRNVRLLGDGPACWALWLMVSRPRTAAFMRWGALPGGYVVGRDEKHVPGGKGVPLMRAIVGDYSRPGDTILDPCAGAATTGRAARMEGRRCILIEQDPDTAAKAAELLRKDARQPSLFSVEALTGKQEGLAL